MLDLLAVNAGLLPKQDPIEAKRALMRAKREREEDAVDAASAGAGVSSL